MTKKDFWCLMIGISVGSLLAMSVFIFVTTSSAETQGKPQDSCKVYYDKAKELAEKSSNSSIAYSQIYRNCKEYDGE